MSTGNLSVKEKWLLAIIGSVPYIQGNTRLQKYGLLVARQILNKEEFFDDWKANDFGGYSKQLAISATKLTNSEFVRTSEIPIGHEKKSIRYEISEKGKAVLGEFVKERQSFKKIKGMLGYYHPKKLGELLNNTYVLYPDLTTKSKIKAEVSRTNTENNSYLSTEYEIAIDEKEPIDVGTTISSSEHVLNDEYFREKLAKSIGLEKIPRLDPKSFDRLSGIISKKIETDEFDSTELVKAARGC